MPSPSRFTKVKIAIGYLLLLFILFIALWFIRKEVANLSVVDTQQILKADSLLALLREKDENTLDILRSLNEVSDKLLSVDELEEIISKSDTVVTQQRVQYKTVVTRDSVIAPVRKKGFFKRVGEVFSPSKKAASITVSTTEELTVDTLIQEINPVDSLHEQIRIATQQKRAINRNSIRRNTALIRQMNEELTEQVDSLIKGYEEEIQSYARQEAEYQQDIRMRSTRIISGIAIGSVLLAAFFLILIWRDITRSNCYRKALEEAHKRAEGLLQAREKLMLTITHDFKAPLSSIIGYTELMGQLSLDNRQQFYLATMQSSSSHLLKLVNDLLDFHRLDLNKTEVNRVAFNPYQLFNEIHASFQPLTTTKGLSLHYEITPQLDSRFISDPLRIRQIVNNLLSNAVKFTKVGSVTLKVMYEASCLIITVSDTGKGMCAEEATRIFQEFTRLSGAQGEEGFGLGLSIVSKLVNLLEGTIQVQSGEGEGSTFTVTIPLFAVIAQEKNVSVTTKDEEEEIHLPDRSLSVLLIDDDNIQLNLTAAMLNHEGITTVCCQQLEELTEYLRRDTFDLLLTDVQMPAINGFDLLTLLRASNIEQARTIPVIAVTARSEIKEEDFLAHGFSGCLRKPFSVRDLCMVIGLHTQANTASETTPEKKEQGKTGLNFSALTAFSEGDEHAARSIIESFVAETAKNADTLKTVLQREDVDAIAAMAHKLLPLFRIIEATDIVPLLVWLEEQKGKPLTDVVKMKTNKILAFMDVVMYEAKAQYNLK